MSPQALYDVLYMFKDIHSVVLDFASRLEDDQLHWRPRGYSTSIGFHLWHLAREFNIISRRSFWNGRPSLFLSLAAPWKFG